MGRDREEGLGVFFDAIQIKVLQVLAGDNDGRVLLPNTFHKVADVFHCGQVGKEQIKLIQTCRRVSLCQKFIAHKRQHIEKQRIF